VVLFRIVKMLLAVLLAAALPASLQAQTIDDGIMLSKGMLFSGSMYTRDTWDEYWEGALERTNENIGTITTQTNTWFANYGVIDRVNVIASVPYVWTRPSQGVLHGISGAQDLTLAVKFNAFEQKWESGAFLRAIAVVSGSVPMTHYNPELLPLSIGLGSKRLSWRGTLNFQSAPGWFVNGSTAWTSRAAVTLDRPYYFTDDEFVMSDQVPMPSVIDYTLSAGYLKDGLMAAGSYQQQNTLGGGDIRRQDMPFVSNRMNVSRLGAMVMYPIPKLRRLAFQFSYWHVVAGRNVGKSQTFTTGFFYLLGSASR
jgi:hypothetical protein